MAGRRAVTEGQLHDEGIQIDINNLRDDDIEGALELAYEDDELDDEDQNDAVAKDSDVDDIDFEHFKGIYFKEDPNRKFIDPDTGAHFEFYDFCKRLQVLAQKRKIIDK